MLHKQTNTDWITVSLISLPLVVLILLTFLLVYFANLISKCLGFLKSRLCCHGRKRRNSSGDIEKSKTVCNQQKSRAKQT
jgi:hypothetical protein